MNKTLWTIGTITRRVVHGVLGGIGAALRRVIMLGLIAVIGVAAVGFTVHTALIDAFSLDRPIAPLDKPGVVFVASDGKPFATRGQFKDKPVAFEELPEHLVEALLAAEDRRFFFHTGLDPIGIIRAAIRNADAGQVVQGGSTLTQQLAKLSYLSSDRTIKRKVREAVLAVWLEANLSKQQILSHYLSLTYYGDGNYGIRTAARRYFGVPVSELSMAQSIFLVGLLKAPSYFSPRSNLAGAKARAKVILRSMLDEGGLTAKRADEIGAEIDALTLKTERDKMASHFADWLFRASSARIKPQYGAVKIKTTLDPRLQKLAAEAVEKIMAAYGKKHNAREAALVAMRPTGEIVAMIGGRDHDKSQFNRAVDSLRQPGSAFKLFVYLAGLRVGYSVHSTFYDAPFKVDKWQPANFGHQFRGPVSLQSAFTSSINTVAVQISESSTRELVIQTARDLGITSPIAPTPSLALGAYEVSLLELTSAFAAVARGRYPVKPVGYMPEAETGLKAKGQPGRKPLDFELMHKEELWYLLNSVARYGTGRRANLNVPTFGKTGTSSDYRDAWFVGFAGDLVIGVWVGNDDNSSMKRVTGGLLPAQIWRAFANKAVDRNSRAAALRWRPKRDMFALPALDGDNMFSTSSYSHIEPDPRRDPHEPAHGTRGFSLPFFFFGRRREAHQDFTRDANTANPSATRRRDASERAKTLPQDKVRKRTRRRGRTIYNFSSQN